MGKILKVFLTAFLCLFLLGMAIGLMEQIGVIPIVIVAIVAFIVVKGKKSSDKSSPAEQAPPEPVKRAEDDEIEKLHVDVED